MDEHHAIVGVHRAIDLLVQSDDQLVPAASSMFPHYADGAAGWSDAFARLLMDRSVAQNVDDVFPDLDDALVQLAEVGPTTTWHAIRRIQTLAALTRVSPEHAPGGGRAELVEQALEHVTPPGSTAGTLHERLADESALNHAEWRDQIDDFFVPGDLD